MGSGFGPPSASKVGNLIVNPGSSTPGALETYIREWRWWATELTAFQAFPSLRDGFDNNAIIPQNDGRHAFGPILDQGTYVTGFRVTGECGASGVAPSGVAETRFFTQARQNLNYLHTNVHAPNGVTRTARMVWEDASHVDFDAQFKLTYVEQKGIEITLMLDVTVPAGRIE